MSRIFMSIVLWVILAANGVFFAYMLWKFWGDGDPVKDDEANDGI